MQRMSDVDLARHLAAVEQIPGNISTVKIPVDLLRDILVDLTETRKMLVVAVRVAEAARELRDEVPEYEKPKEPDHMCTLGITDCDGGCVDWAHWCRTEATKERFDDVLIDYDALRISNVG